MGCAENTRDPSSWVIRMGTTDTTATPENFTGVVLPVFFVKNTLASLRFYRDLCGFKLKTFYDGESGREVKDWTYAEPPTFIRMAASTQEFALHLNRGEFSSIGGNRHYFEVKDIERQYRDIIERGGSPTMIADLPWMRLFSMTDPDGHRIYFQTTDPTWSKGE